jgi:cytochrome b561
MKAARVHELGKILFILFFLLHAGAALLHKLAGHRVLGKIFLLKAGERF